MYEIGKCYEKDSEKRWLILAAAGALRAKSVHEMPREFNFYDIKGDVEDLLESFDVNPGWDAARRPAYYHPGRSLHSGNVLMFGELHPEYADAFKLRQRVYLAEVDVTLLLAAKGKRAVQAIPKFPSIRRDLSLVLDKGSWYGNVRDSILALKIPELVRIEPFDRMETGPFPESKYALAISLTYQSAERTLTDDEVENFDKTILDALKERLGVELRR